MTIYSSWPEAKKALAIDLDNPESFVMAPLEIYTVMGEMINERAATNRHNPGMKLSYSYPGLLDVPRWDFFIDDMMEFFDYVWWRESFLYNIDENGDVITDPTWYDGKPIDEIKTWTQELMEEYLGMERPGPYINEPDYTFIPDWVDPYPGADWLWWHFNALSLFTFAAMHDVYDTPFSGWTKWAEGPTWAEALTNYANTNWYQSFFWVGGMTNSTGFGHRVEQVSSDGRFIIWRIKMENVGMRMPQDPGTVLYGKKCKMYHMPRSYGITGSHINPDYNDYSGNIDQNDVYIEGIYEHDPVYYFVDIPEFFGGGQQERLETLDLSPLGDIDGVTLPKPAMMDVSYGYTSVVTHRNLAPSYWGDQHTSFADFDVVGGYTYRNMRGLLPE